jgi:hypothetical protein
MICFVIIALKRNDAVELIENVIRFEESIVGQYPVYLQPLLAIPNISIALERVKRMLTH